MMEIWTRYNVVMMLLYFKLDKIKILQKKKSHHSEVQIFCYENVLQDPKYWARIKQWWKIDNFSLTYGCPDLLVNDRILVPSVDTNTIEANIDGYLQDIYRQDASVYSNETLFRDIR